MARVNDPVCGMDVDTETSKLKVEREGQTYGFHARRCNLDFQVDPQKSLSPDYQPHV